MQEARLALFRIDFDQLTLQFQGLVYFALFLYWGASLWTRLSAAAATSPGSSYGSSAQGLSLTKPWIAFCAACSLAFGAAATSELGIEFAGTAFAIGLCIGIALLDETASACFVSVSLLLRPWEVLKNNPYLDLLPRLSFALCVGHLILAFASKRKIDINWNSAAAALLALVAWCFMSTLVATDVDSSQKEFFNTIFKAVLLYFTLSSLVRTAAAFRTLMGTFLGGALAIGIISVFQTLGLSALNDENGSRLQSFGAMANTNDVAALMVLCLPFAVTTALRKTESSLVRLFGFTLSAIAIASVAMSRSRGAMLGVAAMLLTLAAIRAGKKALLVVGASCGCLAVAASVFLADRSLSDRESSNQNRQTYLKAGLRMGAHNPLLGVGFNAFSTNLYGYTSEQTDDTHPMVAHNSFVQLFAETGLLGLLLFVAAYYHSMRTSLQIFRRAPEFLLALVGYGVVIFFLSHAYLIFPYLLFGVVGMAAALRRPAPC